MLKNFDSFREEKLGIDAMYSVFAPLLFYPEADF